MTPHRCIPLPVPPTRLARFGAWIIIATFGLLTAPPVQGHELVPGQTEGIGFSQNVGARVPSDLTFRDESGQKVFLGQYFVDRPVVLTMNYLRCQNLCSLVIKGLATSLTSVPLQLGADFTVLTVSIDPSDTPAVAASTKSEALATYAHPESAGGWHVLTGGHREIDRLADAVGFNYGYDADHDEYAHPAGVMVLTPDGRVNRYLYGIDFPPNDLRLALIDAGQGHIGSILDQALLLCYRYDTETGRYTPVVLALVRQLGVLTIVGLGTFMGIMWYGDLRGHRDPPSPGGA